MEAEKNLADSQQEAGPQPYNHTEPQWAWRQILLESPVRNEAGVGLLQNGEIDSVFLSRKFVLICYCSNRKLIPQRF